MNDTVTAESIEFIADHQVPASGTWEISGQGPKRNEWTPTGFLRQIGLSAILAASPVTTGVDPWFVDRRQQLPITLNVSFDAVLGRPISVIEARNLALQILMHAEERRSLFAEEEARQGFDWERNL